MAEASRTESLDLNKEHLFHTLLDFESYPQFVSSVHKTEVLSRSENEMTVRFELEMIKKLYYVIKVQWDKGEESSEVRWSLVESDLLKKNNGNWSLKSKGTDSTDVTYSLDLDFNISVPNLILKGLVKKSLPKAIKEFYNESKRRNN